MDEWQGAVEGVERLMSWMEFYKGKRVLVTGHTGFKGSWLCRILVNAGAEVTGYSLKAPTEPTDNYKSRSRHAGPHSLSFPFNIPFLFKILAVPCEDFHIFRILKFFE